MYRRLLNSRIYYLSTVHFSTTQLLNGNPMLLLKRTIVEHFSRALCANAARAPFAAVALLALLWLRATHTDSPVIHTGYAAFAQLIPSRRRWDEVLRQLQTVGALRRVGTGFQLLSPAIDTLDEDLRSEVEALRATQPPPKDEDDRRAHARAKREAEQRRRDVLAHLGKSPSDVRDTLAHIGRVPKNSLTYQGKGCGPVRAAIDWLADTGATWRDFLRVCKTAMEDVSEDRPTELHWLFVGRHSAYLQRIVSQVGDSP